MMNEIKLLDSKNYIWLALTVAMLFLLWIQLPRILDPYAIEEDLRTIFYYYRHINPELFPTVDLASQMAMEVQLGSRIFVIETSSPGFSLLYQVAGNFVSFILFSKLLAFPLMFFAVFYLYRIGEKLSGSGTALVLTLAFSILILSSTSEISILSGLHRAFAVPLTLGLIYYLLEKRYRSALITLFLTGIIYPPIIPVALLTYGFNLISLWENGQWRIKIKWRQAAELVVVVLLVIVSIAPTIFLQVDNAQGATAVTGTSDEGIIGNPQYEIGGRRPLFIAFPFIGRGGLTTAAQDGLHLLILSIFALLVLVVRRSNTTRPPAVVMKLLYASLLGFALAWIAILLTSSFLLYLPSRHSRVGLFLFLLIFVSINFQETLRVSVGWIMQRRQKLIWYLLPLAVVALGFAFFLPNPDEENAFDFRGPFASASLIGLTLLLIVLTIIVSRRRNQAYVSTTNNQVPLPGRLTWIILGSIVVVFSLFYVQFMLTDIYSPSEDSVLLFNFVETLPKDTLLAGSPCALDSIQFYGKRTVLFSCERFPMDDQMILDGLRAYFAAEKEQVISFCRDYGVTHLVVDESSFQREYIINGDYFFEPYTSILAPEFENRTDFALEIVPEELKLFQAGTVFLVECGSKL